MLPWHHFLWIRSADGCGVAFAGPSDAPCGSSVISDSPVSTETRTRWAGKQWSCNKMTSPSPTLSDSSSSSKHDGNQVSVCADLRSSKSVCLKIFWIRLSWFPPDCIVYCCRGVSFQDSWEIIEGLRGFSANVQEPDRQEGFLLKRRKWPMKGWHKVSISDVTLRAWTLLKTYISCIQKSGSMHIMYIHTYVDPWSHFHLRWMRKIQHINLQSLAYVVTFRSQPRVVSFSGREARCLFWGLHLWLISLPLFSLSVLM